MELLELLRVLQNSQNQANAEQNRELIIKLAEAMQHSIFITWCFLTIIAIGLVLVYLDHRKLKKQLAKIVK